MDSQKITRMLSKCEATHKYFTGTFPEDKIEMPMWYPASMVVNLDESSEPGSHWVAIFAKSPNDAMYFDSYGQQPKGNILAVLKKFRKVTTSDFVIQSIISNVCAAYCIYFIYMASKGRNYEEILSSIARRSNMDAFVRSFVIKFIIERE